MKENYERWMNREIQRFQARGEVPRLLLHSCCAPCSSAVLESVFRYFEITVFYYNPNIFPKEEYLHRVQEQKRFLAQFPPASSVTFLEGDYQPERFFQLAQGLEQEPEGGERCARCYELRLRRTAAGHWCWPASGTSGSWRHSNTPPFSPAERSPWAGRRWD